MALSLCIWLPYFVFVKSFASSACSIFDKAEAKKWLPVNVYVGTFSDGRPAVAFQKLAASFVPGPCQRQACCGFTLIFRCSDSGLWFSFLSLVTLFFASCFSRRRHRARYSAPAVFAIHHAVLAQTRWPCSPLSLPLPINPPIPQRALLTSPHAFVCLVVRRLHVFGQKNDRVGAESGAIPEPAHAR